MLNGRIPKNNVKQHFLPYIDGNSDDNKSYTFIYDDAMCHIVKSVNKSLLDPVLSCYENAHNIRLLENY